MTLGATLATAIFIIIGLMAFWLLAFLMAFVIPYWAGLGGMQMLRPKRLTEEEAES